MIVVTKAKWFEVCMAENEGSPYPQYTKDNPCSLHLHFSIPIQAYVHS